MKLTGFTGLKIISVVLLCIILIMSMTMSVFADLSIWLSDANTIGTWKGTDIKYAHKKLNNNSYFYFYAGGIYAINEWSDALGVPIENVLLMSEANIKVYGGTWDEITALGFYCDKTNVLGYVASFDSDPIVDSAQMLDGRKVSVSRFKGAVVVILDKGLMSNYNYVTTHELGHALGWLGHSSDKNDVMYAIRNGMTTLTDRDKEHLLQVY